MSITAATAITTAAIAVLVAIITWRQWVTNRDRLRNELFDRRYVLFEQTRDLSRKSYSRVTCPEASRRDFCAEPAGPTSFLLVTVISRSSSLISIGMPAGRLHAPEATLDSLTGDERRMNVDAQRSVKDWFEETLGSLESRFEKYLKLTH